ncbi:MULTISPECIES: hypothetical protein [Bacillus]|uniref:hypothetical protein n=1 Tax=Bacillus TaxID=1386 RepID=UPI0003F59F57|nr:hypothetical protein [Bacillus subtilis]CJS85040.1 Uncharacterised protein [Streptococcus pneumoniae]ASB91735.1 hypothetical protein S101392_00212 [Bacillus subtilis subsp. subtilis]MBR0007819.1 hypothetical protein [Bacillus subtilis]MCB7163227.1 hypothetical protein [Bacillus subtilis]MCB7461824.1 hypothetical protein [Bacillus subtilis]
MAIENRNICSLSGDEKENLLLLHSAELLENISQSKEKYRKIIQAGIAQWVKDFQSGHIKVNTVDDLKKLIELDIELQKDEDLY